MVLAQEDRKIIRTCHLLFEKSPGRHWVILCSYRKSSPGSNSCFPTTLTLYYSLEDTSCFQYESISIHFDFSANQGKIFQIDHDPPRVWNRVFVSQIEEVLGLCRTYVKVSLRRWEWKL